MEKIEKQLLEIIADQSDVDQAHDLTHVKRVVEMAKHLCFLEGANIEIVLPAACLHDCVLIPKNSDERKIASALSADRAIQYLEKFGYNSDYFKFIHHAIVAHSYSANVQPLTLEAKIIQDADRMDALGAIGISRCMQVGGSLGLQLYCHDDPFCVNRSLNDREYIVDHFYEKLLKIGKSMQTTSAKNEAMKRVDYMEGFLDQLKIEINYM